MTAHWQIFLEVRNHRCCSSYSCNCPFFYRTLCVIIVVDFVDSV
jgi:hypothetical protein